MSSFNARAAVLALCLLLAGCGFAPLYGGAGMSQKFAGVQVENIPDRDGQHLRNLLIDRIYTGGRPENPRYALKIAPLTTTATELGIQKDATVTRTGIEITAHMMLVDRSSGKVVLARTLHAVGGYDVLDQQYATLVTRQNVTEHILAELADGVTQALSLYFRAVP